MSQFEYILIPLGMLAAISVSELMASWARLIRTWETTQASYLYVSFSLFLVLNLLFGHFNGLWTYRVLEFTPLATFFVLLPTLLFSIAMLVLAAPASMNDELNEHYFETSPKSAAIAFSALIVSTATDLLPGLVFDPSMLAPLSVMGAALICIVISNSLTIHIGANVVLWLIWLVFLVVPSVYA